MKTLHLVLTAVLASSLVTAAHATTYAQAARERVVRFADLDLSQKADMEKLERRIRIAARDVCWTPGISSIVFAGSMYRCTRDAAAAAMAKVTAIAAARNPQRTVAIRGTGARE